MSNFANARAVADLTDGTILATVEIAAPTDAVFNALTTGDEITRWWGSPETYQTTEWVGDVRPGGRWRASGVGADGGPFSVEGEFIEVTPGRKLVQTWQADWDGGNVTTVAFLLDAIAGGTRLTLWHKGFAGRPDSCRGHGDGWEMVLGWLARHCAPSDQRCYLFRLLPPRATFPLDMSAAEAEVMKNHVAYWTELLQRRVAVVFGPVADPKGPWGVGVVRVSSETEIDRLSNEDPAILSGLGFRYEILPMMRMVTAQ
ncbi:MAG: SRPBCC domain-containing protein [Hyphomicrobiales bacterium]|nr:SRPBCC domain-containing protein [Hyphomicrobiales bacterium]